MKVFVGSDHAGFGLKKLIVAYLKKSKMSFEDFGVFDESSVDYPDVAFEVANAVAKDKSAKGILVCGTGTGMVIAANKVKGVRAAVIYDVYSAKMSRFDNDANIACLRGRKFNKEKALRLIKIWLKTNFSNCSRHKRRIEKIKSFETKC